MSAPETAAKVVRVSIETNIPATIYQTVETAAGARI
jgi:hypothetical protein